MFFLFPRHLGTQIYKNITLRIIKLEKKYIQHINIPRKYIFGYLNVLTTSLINKKEAYFKLVFQLQVEYDINLSFPDLTAKAMRHYFSQISINFDWRMDDIDKYFIIVSVTLDFSCFLLHTFVARMELRFLARVVIS